jgi:hypothetical protein
VIDAGIAQARQHKKIEIGGGVAHSVRRILDYGWSGEKTGRQFRKSCAKYPPKDGIDVLKVMVEVEVCLELFVGKLCPHVLIGLEQ